MARVNVGARSVVTTHEGAPARRISALQELRRSVMACLLWEDSFYEDGEDIATRLRELSHRVTPTELAELAIECRTHYRMRHAPLLLVRELLRHPHAGGAMVGDAVAAVIQRADEIGELVSLYCASNDKRAWPKQLKRGIALAFNKFDAYQLAKYDRASDKARLRDALFLSHAKPANEQRAGIWRQLVDGTLPSPDTWEVGLSSGGDKRETFTRLLAEGKLGYMALLRNLRNMAEAGVDQALVTEALRAGAAKSKALPFRFIAAARACPQLEPVLDECMQTAVAQLPRLSGDTIVLVDVSGSMRGAKVSARSDMDRLDAACALAALVRGVCNEVRIVTFSEELVTVAPRHGMALVDAIKASQRHRGTYLGQAVDAVQKRPHDRLIVITDEQSHDRVENPKARGYMLNVGTYRNGVGYGPWTHIDGWSEQVVRFIQEIEAAETQ